MSNNPQIRRLAIWWLAANSTGAAISIFIERYVFYQGVKTGSFKYAPGGHEVIHIFWWLAYEIVLGAFQVLTCCWLISLVKVQGKIFQVALGGTLGILTALLFTWLPVLVVDSVLWLEPLIGIYVFLLSGIVFGTIAGYSQWRAVFHK
jgi:hypothetical protein